jgi:Spy/CpxP family protein refolding chaperone
MRVCLLALVATLALQPALAQSPQPSEKSVLQLLQMMHTHQIMENAWAQMDGAMRSSMKAARSRKRSAMSHRPRWWRS